MNLYWNIDVYRQFGVMLKKCIFNKKRSASRTILAYLLCSFYLMKLGTETSIDKIIEKIKNAKVKKQDKLEEIVSCVMYASNMHPLSKCLDRTLVMATFLHKSGYQFRVNIGLVKNNCMNGHAWIEMDLEGGRKVIDVYDMTDELIITKSWEI